jgi:AbiJ-like protein
MLTDVFYRRYTNFHLKDTFDPSDAAFFVQAHRLLVDQVFPYWSAEGKKNEHSVHALTNIHDRLSIEIGVHELSPKYYSYQNASGVTISGTWEYDHIIRQYLCAQFQETYDVTSFIMRRISLVELGFQLKESQVAYENAELPRKLAEAKRVLQNRGRGTITVPGDPTEWLRVQNRTVNETFLSNAAELNARFQQAGYPFHYHNGFVQISRDALILTQVEKPFWDLIADGMWMNVDTDMKEAIDRRDNNGRDPAFYAAKALESAIKIISDQKGASTGHEKGAHNYIDNLISARAGRFIDQWEADALKSLFKDNRNPFGHGPGSAPMPQLNAQQTEWVIETCMSWTKSLVRRFSSSHWECGCEIRIGPRWDLARPVMYRIPLTAPRRIPRDFPRREKFCYLAETNRASALLRPLNLLWPPD